MITKSQIKNKSIESVSSLMGINIVRLAGRSRQRYYISNDDGIIVGFLGQTRVEVSKSLLSCFTIDELGTTLIPIEGEAKVFMEPTHDIDQLQGNSHRPDLTGHDSLCDYIRCCYRQTLLGKTTDVE